MSDRYQFLAHTPVGRFVVKNLGLPDPPPLQRWTPGGPLVDGTVVVGRTEGGRVADAVQRLLAGMDVATTETLADGARAKGLVLDATGIGDVAGLAALREFFTPLLRRLEPNARLVVLGTPPSLTKGVDEHVAQRALEGFTRSLGKEMRAGATAQLVQVAPGAEDALGSTLAFLLSPKSAYVSGQVVRVGVGGPTVRRHRRLARRPLPGGWCWSPAPPAASAPPWHGSCTATARPSSASTCPRSPRTCRS